MNESKVKSDIKNICKQIAIQLFIPLPCLIHLDHFFYLFGNENTKMLPVLFGWITAPQLCLLSLTVFKPNNCCN